MRDSLDVWGANVSMPDTVANAIAAAAADFQADAEFLRITPTDTSKCRSEHRRQSCGRWTRMSRASSKQGLKC
jgi:hypothetical protein